MLTAFLRDQRIVAPEAVQLIRHLPIWSKSKNYRWTPIETE